MRKVSKLIRKTIKFVNNFIVFVVVRLFQATKYLLPAAIVFFALSCRIAMYPGIPLVRPTDSPAIHELIPNTRWGNLRPCGTLFDEKVEFDKALQCVNNKVWPTSQIQPSNPLLPVVPPRCFVVSVDSPDVASANDLSFNGIPIITMSGVGFVVGFYQPLTRTIFLIENLDAPAVYRHELQHLFLHFHDPESQGLGHDQSVWEQCEPPFYDPSINAKILASIRALNQ